MRPFLLLLIGCTTPAVTDKSPAVDDTGTPSTQVGAPLVGPPGTGLTDTADTTLNGPAPDYRQQGPHSTSRADDSAQVATCRMDYTAWLPTGTKPQAVVILAHGMQRSRAQVAVLAEHWATWGLAVATPNLCHASIFDSDHDANAQDLHALADHLGAGLPVLYAGHSAGGLASFLAAAEDPNAIGWFGLDPVDYQGVGLAAAGTHGFATWALLGESQLCNSNANADGWFAGAEGRALRISGADHCDFEDPTDLLCTGLCQSGNADDEDVRELVRGFSTAFAVWKLGVDPQGERWWTPGESWYDLAAAVTTEI